MSKRSKSKPSSNGGKTVLRKVAVRAARSRANVQVVEFTGESGNFENKASKHMHSGSNIGNNGSSKDMRMESRTMKRNIHDAWDGVMELGASGLDKRERKRVDAEKLADLGIARPKAQKIPLRVLFSMKKTHAVREAKREAEIKASGVVVGKKTKKEKEREKKRADDIHKWRGGSFHGGVLRLKTSNKM